MIFYSNLKYLPLIDFLIPLQTLLILLLSILVSLVQSISDSHLLISLPNTSTSMTHFLTAFGLSIFSTITFSYLNTNPPACLDKPLQDLDMFECDKLKQSAANLTYLFYFICFYCQNTASYSASHIG